MSKISNQVSGIKKTKTISRGEVENNAETSTETPSTDAVNLSSASDSDVTPEASSAASPSSDSPPATFKSAKSRPTLVRSDAGATPTVRFKDEDNVATKSTSGAGGSAATERPASDAINSGNREGTTMTVTSATGLIPGTGVVFSTTTAVVKSFPQTTTVGSCSLIHPKVPPTQSGLPSSSASTTNSSVISFSTASESDNTAATETYCTQYKENLQDALESSKDFASKIGALESAVEQFAAQRPTLLSSSSEISTTFHKLFIECATAVLSADWFNCGDDVRKAFSGAIQRAHEVLRGFDLPLLQHVLELIERPWNERHPTLSAILSGEEDLQPDEVLSYIESESPSLLLLFVDFLAKQDCQDLAARLATACLSHPKYADNLTMREAQLLCLYRTGDLGSFTKEVKSITCDHGVALIQRLQQTQPDAEDVALKLAQACTLQDWVKPTYYCCTKDLLWLWCELQARADGSLDTFAHSVLKVAQLAANSLQLGMLIQVLHRMFGGSSLQLCVQLATLGLRMDREALDMALKASDRPSAANAEGDLAHTCLTLTCVFTNQILARQLCNLTAFSLSPDEKKYRLLEAAEIHPKSKDADGTTSCESDGELTPCAFCKQKWAIENPPVGGVGITTAALTKPDGECRCAGKNRPLTPHEQTVLQNGRILLQNVEETVTKDLIDTLDSVRDPGLDLSLPWASLKTQCLALLESKAGLSYAKETDSFTLNDQPESVGGSASSGGLLSGEGVASCGGQGVDGDASGDGSLSNAGSVNGSGGQGQANASKVKKRFMCSLCGKRYFTVSALKKHHALHGENSTGSSNNNTNNTITGGNSETATDVESKIPKAEPVAESGNEVRDGVSLDGNILAIDGLTQPVTSVTAPSHGTTTTIVGPDGKERSFVCVYCRKAFSQKHHLDQHMTLHTGRRLYACPTCGRKVSTKGNLSRHLKQVHSLADDEATRLCETVNPEIEKPPLLTVSPDENLQGTYQVEKNHPSRTPIVPPTILGPDGKPQPVAIVNAVKANPILQLPQPQIIQQTSSSPQILVASQLPQLPQLQQQQPQIIVATPVASAASTAIGVSTSAPQGSSIVTIPVTAVGTVSMAQNIQAPIGATAVVNTSPISNPSVTVVSPSLSVPSPGQRPKKYVCTTCGKAFSTRGNLEIHKHEHQIESVPASSVASPLGATKRLDESGASSPSSLLSPEAESPEPPLEGGGGEEGDVDAVDETFDPDVLTAQVESHVIAKENPLLGTDEAGVGSKPLPKTIFQCNICGKEYNLRGHLKDHIHVHLGVKPHRCNICRRGFAWMHNLDRHLKSVHKILATATKKSYSGDTSALEASIPVAVRTNPLASQQPLQNTSPLLSVITSQKDHVSSMQLSPPTSMGDGECSVKAAMGNQFESDNEIKPITSSHVQLDSSKSSIVEATTATVAPVGATIVKFDSTTELKFNSPPSSFSNSASDVIPCKISKLEGSQEVQSSIQPSSPAAGVSEVVSTSIATTTPSSLGAISPGAVKQFRTFKCAQCSKKFPSILALTSHKMKVHKTKGTMIVGTARQAPPISGGIDANGSLALPEIDSEIGCLNSPNTVALVPETSSMGPSIIGTSATQAALGYPSGVIAVNSGPGGQTVLVSAAELSNYTSQMEDPSILDDDDDIEEDMEEEEEVALSSATPSAVTAPPILVQSSVAVANPVMAVGIPSIGPDGENIIEYEEGTIGPGGAPVSKHNPLGEIHECHVCKKRLSSFFCLQRHIFKVHKLPKQSKKDQPGWKPGGGGPSNKPKIVVVPQQQPSNSGAVAIGQTQPEALPQQSQPAQQLPQQQIQQPQHVVMSTVDAAGNTVQQVGTIIHNAQGQPQFIAVSSCGPTHVMVGAPTSVATPGANAVATVLGSGPRVVTVQQPVNQSMIAPGAEGKSGANTPCSGVALLGNSQGASVATMQVAQQFLQQNATVILQQPILQVQQQQQQQQQSKMQLQPAQPILSSNVQQQNTSMDAPSSATTTAQPILTESQVSMDSAEGEEVKNVVEFRTEYSQPSQPQKEKKRTGSSSGSPDKKQVHDKHRTSSENREAADGDTGAGATGSVSSSGAESLTSPPPPDASANTSSIQFNMAAAEGSTPQQQQPQQILFAQQQLQQQLLQQQALVSGLSGQDLGETVTVATPAITAIDSHQLLLANQPLQEAVEEADDEEDETDETDDDDDGIKNELKLALKSGGVADNVGLNGATLSVVEGTNEITGEPTRVEFDPSQPLTTEIMGGPIHSPNDDPKTPESKLKHACRICGRTVSNRDSLKRHWKIHLKGAQPAESSTPNSVNQTTTTAVLVDPQKQLSRMDSRAPDSIDVDASVPSQIAFSVAASSTASSVTGVTLGPVIQAHDVTGDPIAVGKANQDLDSDSEMTDGQSIQTPGKPRRIRTVKAEDRIPINCPLCDKLLAGRINLNRHIKLHKKRGDEVPDPETLKQYAAEKIAEQQEQQLQQLEEEQQQHQQDEVEVVQQQAALPQAALQPQLDLVTMLQTGQLQQVLTVDEHGNQQIVFQMVTPDGQSLLTDPATTQQLLIQQQQLIAATQLANQQAFIQQTSVVQSPDQLQQLQQFQVAQISQVAGGAALMEDIGSQETVISSGGNQDNAVASAAALGVAGVADVADVGGNPGIPLAATQEVDEDDDEVETFNLDDVIEAVATGTLGKKPPKFPTSLQAEIGKGPPVDMLSIGPEIITAAAPEPEIKRFKCNLCGAEVMSNQSLKRHIKGHEAKRLKEQALKRANLHSTSALQNDAAAAVIQHQRNVLQKLPPNSQSASQQELQQQHIQLHQQHKQLQQLQKQQQQQHRGHGQFTVLEPPSPSGDLNRDDRASPREIHDRASPREIHDPGACASHEPQHALEPEDEEDEVRRRRRLQHRGTLVDDDADDEDEDRLDGVEPGEITGHAASRGSLSLDDTGSDVESERSAATNATGASVERQPKVHFCDQCKKTFYNSYNLKRHVKAVHEGVKPLIKLKRKKDEDSSSNDDAQSQSSQPVLASQLGETAESAESPSASQTDFNTSMSAQVFGVSGQQIIFTPAMIQQAAELLSGTGSGQLLFNEHGQVVSSTDPAATAAVQAALVQAQQQLQTQQWSQQLLSGSQVQQVMVDPSTLQLQGSTDATLPMVSSAEAASVLGSTTSGHSATLDGTEPSLPTETGHSITTTGTTTQSNTQISADAYLQQQHQIYELLQQQQQQQGSDSGAAATVQQLSTAELASLENVVAAQQGVVGGDGGGNGSLVATATAIAGGSSISGAATFSYQPDGTLTMAGGGQGGHDTQVTMALLGQSQPLMYGQQIMQLPDGSFTQTVAYGTVAAAAAAAADSSPSGVGVSIEMPTTPVDGDVVGIVPTAGAAAADDSADDQSISDGGVSPSKTTVSQITMNNRYRCSECARGLSTGFSLKRHMHTVHNIPKETPLKTLSATSGLIRTVVRADDPDAESSAMQKLGVALTAAANTNVSSQISMTTSEASSAPMLAAMDANHGEGSGTSLNVVASMVENPNLGNSAISSELSIQAADLLGLTAMNSPSNPVAAASGSELGSPVGLGAPPSSAITTVVGALDGAGGLVGLEPGEIGAEDTEAALAAQLGIRVLDDEDRNDDDLEEIDASSEDRAPLNSVSAASRISLAMTSSPGVAVVSSLAEIGVAMPALAPSMLASPSIDAASATSNEGLFDAISEAPVKDEEAETASAPDLVSGSDCGSAQEAIQTTNSPTPRLPCYECPFCKCSLASAEALNAHIETHISHPSSSSDADFEEDGNDGGPPHKKIKTSSPLPPNASLTAGVDAPLTTNHLDHGLPFVGDSNAAQVIPALVSSDVSQTAVPPQPVPRRSGRERKKKKEDDDDDDEPKRKKSSAKLNAIRQNNVMASSIFDEPEPGEIMVEKTGENVDEGAKDMTPRDAVKTWTNEAACPRCERQFKSANLLAKHIVKCQLTTIVGTAAVSAPVLNSKPTVGLDATEKTLPSIAASAAPVKTAGPKKFECGVCGRLLGSAAALSRHSTTHANNEGSQLNFPAATTTTTTNGIEDDEPEVAAFISSAGKKVEKNTAALNDAAVATRKANRRR